ncbi:hypothetical protein C8F01DRAFT_1259551 [Mycena amicta]|nr:hypothetical protein C8F01DRAFT_1259551 [Mycena amicta]
MASALADVFVPEEDLDAALDALGALLDPTQDNVPIVVAWIRDVEGTARQFLGDELVQSLGSDSNAQTTQHVLDAFARSRMPIQFAQELATTLVGNLFGKQVDFDSTVTPIVQIIYEGTRRVMALRLERRTPEEELTPPTHRGSTPADAPPSPGRDLHSASEHQLRRSPSGTPTSASRLEREPTPNSSLGRQPSQSRPPSTPHDLDPASQRQPSPSPSTTRRKVEKTPPLPLHRDIMEEAGFLYGMTEWAPEGSMGLLLERTVNEDPHAPRGPCLFSASQDGAIIWEGW